MAHEKVLHVALYVQYIYIPPATAPGWLYHGGTKDGAGDISCSVYTPPQQSPYVHATNVINKAQGFFVDN